MATTRLTSLALPGAPQTFAAKEPIPSAAWLLGVDDDTLLLIHADGDDGSIAFTDAAMGRTLSIVGDVTNSHDRAKFGNGSIKLLGDYGLDAARVSAAASSDWDFGTGGLTVDFWAWSYAATNRPHFCGWYTDPSNLLEIGKHSEFGTGLIRYRARYVLLGATVFDIVTDPLDVQDEWAHFAFVRDGSAVRLYINGSLAASGTVSASLDLDLSAMAMIVGRTGLDGMDGHLDEFRVSSVARYSSNFVPQSEPYSGTRAGACRGTADLLNARAGAARGSSNLIISVREGAARGSAHFIGYRSGASRGTSILVNSREAAARGASDWIVHSYTGASRGSAVLLEARAGASRGRSALLATGYAGASRGIATLRSERSGAARGTADWMQTYTAASRGAAAWSDGVARYELFRGVGAMPDLEAAPWETFTTLPHETAALTYPNTYYFVLRRRNAYGLVSPHVERWTLILNAAGAEGLAAPSTPTDITMVVEWPNFRARATYVQANDPRSVVADTWTVWRTQAVGTPADPDRVLDLPAHEEAMVFVGGVANLDALINSLPLVGGTTKVDVAATRSGTPDVHSAAAIYSFLHDTGAPPAPSDPQFTTYGG